MEKERETGRESEREAKSLLYDNLASPKLTEEFNNFDDSRESKYERARRHSQVKDNSWP